MTVQTFIDRDAVSGENKQYKGADVSTGAPDAGRLVALDTTGLIDPSMLPGFDHYKSVEAFENLAAWDQVEIFPDSGVFKARKASAAAATPRPAMAFVRQAWTTGQIAKLYNEGTVGGQTGLTAGQRIYLSATTPGAISTAPITGAGKLHQFLGRASSVTEFEFEIDDHLVLAA